MVDDIKVYDVNGEPLEGVELTIDGVYQGKTDKTDETGTIPSDILD